MQKKVCHLIVLIVVAINFPISVIAEDATATNSPLQQSQLSSESLQAIKTDQTTASIESSPPTPEAETVQAATEEEQNQPTAVTEEPAVVEKRAQPFAAEMGTEANPYLVTNFAELKEALAIVPAADETVYIQFQNDIVYDGPATIKQNTVIDGNGHYLLYGGASFAAAHFKTGANNLNITYKNMKIGNIEYPNSTYYGILYAGNTNTHFTVENIQYTMVKGGQPFWGNNGVGNVLEIKGDNSFYSSGTLYGGEFVEGYRNVVFAEDSHTVIYNDTPTATSVFWSTAQVVTIGERAVVSIEASKPRLFYGDDATLDILEQGKLNYKKINGAHYKNSESALSYLGTLSVNMAKDSIAEFTTETASFSGKTPTFNLDSPDHVFLATNSPNTPVFSSTLRPVFQRFDADDFTYRLAYLANNNQVNYVSSAQTGTSYTVTSAAIENGYSIAYARAPKLETVVANAETAPKPNISRLRAQIESVTPLTTRSSRVQYKLATKQLYTGTDSSDPLAQENIEQATAANGVLQALEVPLSETDQSTGLATQGTFQQLAAGNYYLYAKVDDVRITGYAFESPWQEIQAEVPVYQMVQFSDTTMNFTSPVSGLFGPAQNLAEYTVRNVGNIATAVRLQKIVRNPASDATLALVEQFTTYKQELQLSLVAETATSKEKIIMGPLTEKEQINQPSVPLQPFWQSDSQALLYFTGNYTGPMAGPKNVSYRFTFAVSANNTE